MGKRGKYEAKGSRSLRFWKKTPDPKPEEEAMPPEPEMEAEDSSPEMPLPVQDLTEEPAGEPPEERSPKKREIWRPLLTGAVTVLCVGMLMICAASFYFLSWDYWDLFGHQAFLVSSEAGEDLVVIREVNPYDLQEGDIIAYFSEDPAFLGQPVVRKICGTETEENGLRSFRTCDLLGTEDPYPVNEFMTLGIYQFTVPNMGAFFGFLPTFPGYLCCVFLPFALLVLIFGSRILGPILEKRGRRKQDTLTAQQSLIEAQQRQIAAMEEEMRHLREEKQEEFPEY